MNLAQTIVLLAKVREEAFDKDINSLEKIIDQIIDVSITHRNYKDGIIWNRIYVKKWEAELLDLGFTVTYQDGSPFAKIYL